VWHRAPTSDFAAPGAVPKMETPQLRSPPHPWPPFANAAFAAPQKRSTARSERSARPGTHAALVNALRPRTEAHVVPGVRSDGLE
jgi:hypothetical protein